MSENPPPRRRGLSPPPWRLPPEERPTPDPLQAPLPPLDLGKGATPLFQPPPTEPPPTGPPPTGPPPAEPPPAEPPPAEPPLAEPLPVEPPPPAAAGAAPSVGAHRLKRNRRPDAGPLALGLVLVVAGIAGAVLIATAGDDDDNGALVRRTVTAPASTATPPPPGGLRPLRRPGFLILRPPAWAVGRGPENSTTLTAPSGLVRVTVFVDRRPDLDLEALEVLAQRTLAGSFPRARVATPARLRLGETPAGRVTVAAGDGRERSIVVLADDALRYAIELDVMRGASAADHRAGDATVATFRSRPDR